MTPAPSCWCAIARSNCSTPARRSWSIRIPGAFADGDKNHDTTDFVATCRAHGVTLHVVQNNGRAGGSAIDECTTRRAGYAVTERTRKFIEQVFGWRQTVGRIRQVMFRGLRRVDLLVLLTQAACNQTRMRTPRCKRGIGATGGEEMALRPVEQRIRALNRHQPNRRSDSMNRSAHRWRGVLQQPAKSPMFDLRKGGIDGRVRIS